MLPNIAALYVLVASIGKFLDISAFYESLDGWVLLPDVSLPAIAILIPIAELALSLLVILNMKRTTATRLLTLLLLAFTGVYLCHTIMADPPQCNCLGKLA